MTMDKLEGSFLTSEKRTHLSYKFYYFLYISPMLNLLNIIYCVQSYMKVRKWSWEKPRDFVKTPLLFPSLGYSWEILMRFSIRGKFTVQGNSLWISNAIYLDLIQIQLGQMKLHVWLVMQLRWLGSSHFRFEKMPCSSALQAEARALLKAIPVAHSKGRNRIGLRTDAMIIA